MTVEEIEIIVTAKVEEALKNFDKLAPAFKEKIKELQNAMSQIDTKQVQNKVSQAVHFVQKKVQDVKKSIENNKINIKVNNTEAKQQVTQLEKEIDSLQKKISGKQLKLDIVNSSLDKIRYDTNQSVIKEMPDAGNKRITAETYARLDNDNNYNSLIGQSDKLNNEIIKYNDLLNGAKSKMAQLGQSTSKTSSFLGKFSSFFSPFVKSVGKANIPIKQIGQAFNNIGKIGQNLLQKESGFGKGLKSGLSHVMRYAMALFSLRTIYSAISNSAQAWLSSQNAGAQQLSANINYMKYAMGSVFAPVIQYVTNLIYQLMRAIQSVVYALFRVNIFAKASAQSMKGVASGAKQAKNESKSLASVHSEINNIGGQESTGGSGGSGSTAPNIDLSKMGQMSTLGQKLYDFFKPLKDSWDNYGTQVVASFKHAISGIGEAVSAMWKSVEQLFTNGTIYQIISNILDSIGNIGTAWANAWNNDNNGTELLQAVADIIKGITDRIKEFTESKGFQTFLNGIVSFFSGVAQFLKPVIDGFTKITEKFLEWVATGVGQLLKWIGDKLQEIAQNEKAQQVLETIGEDLGIIAIVTLSVVSAWKAWKAISELCSIEFSKEQLIIIAIIAVITAVILIIKHWGAITDWIKDKWNTVVSAIKGFIENMKNSIKDKFNQIKENIHNTMNNIKDKWDEKWQQIKDKVISIWEGIKNGIKSIINNILGGIEGFVNGTIRGINKLLSGVSKVANAVGSLIGLKPVNLSISEIHIPRLAKGNVAYEETLAIFGEYSNARNNPEITTPQNVMRETFEDVLSNRGAISGQSIHLTVNYLGKNIFDDTIEYINEKTRRTNKNTIIQVEGG